MLRLLRALFRLSNSPFLCRSFCSLTCIRMKENCKWNGNGYCIVLKFTPFTSFFALAIQCGWFVFFCLLCWVKQLKRFYFEYCLHQNAIKSIINISAIYLFTHYIRIQSQTIAYHLHTRSSRALYNNNRFISIWHGYGHNWYNGAKETMRLQKANRIEWNCYKTIKKMIVNLRFCFFCWSNFLTFDDSWRVPSFLLPHFEFYVDIFYWGIGRLVLFVHATNEWKCCQKILFLQSKLNPHCWSWYASFQELLRFYWFLFLLCRYFDLTFFNICGYLYPHFVAHRYRAEMHKYTWASLFLCDLLKKTTTKIQYLNFISFNQFYYHLHIESTLNLAHPTFIY